MNRALSFLFRSVERLLYVYAEVIFSRSRVAGGLLLAATAMSPTTCAFGIGAVAVAYAGGRALGLIGAGPDSPLGPMGYNALLVGLGLSTIVPSDGWGIAFLVGAVLFSLFVTSGLVATFRSANAPVLSLPFVLSMAVVAPLSFAVGVGTIEPRPPLVSVFGVHSPATQALSGFGTLFFVPLPEAGLLIALALLWHSRIASLLGALGALLAIGVSDLGPTRGGTEPLQLLALNAGLSAVAVGAVYFVPSAGSFGSGLAASGVALAFALGASDLLTRLGPAGVLLPFNVAVLMVLFTMRLRVTESGPVAVDFIPGSPEENLAYHNTRRARFRALYTVSFRLPFRGAWTCTQGVDGAITHKGAFRHGFDFEVCGPDGRVCSGTGTELSDYHCFKLPVLAMADGTVVTVHKDVPDNRIGEQNVRQNWGNVVVLQHGVGLFSVVAHLACGSIRVREGQFVRRGDLLGLAGSSGRSPQPHLHVQLQSTGQLGAPTLPCRFSDVVRAGENEALEVALTPEQGDTLRPLLAPDTAGTGLGWDPGSAFALEHGGRREHIDVELDLFGNYILRSREYGTTLCFVPTEEGLTLHDPIGSKRSALHVLRAALPRLPLDRAGELSWHDYMTMRTRLPWPLSALYDFVSPFDRRQGLRLRYLMEQTDTELLIFGDSLQTRKGVPLVRTKVVIRKGIGLVALERTVGDSSQSIARVVVEGPEDEALEIPHMLFHPKTLRRLVMNRAKWLSAAVLLVSCARSGIEQEPPMTAAPALPRAEASMHGPAQAPAAHGEQPGLTRHEPAALSLRTEASALFQKSYELEAAGKLDAALSSLDGASPRGPAAYVLQLRRGWLLYRLGRHTDSIVAYNKALALDARSVEARVGLLAPLVALRRWLDVESTAREAKKIDPNNYSATIRLAFAEYNQAKFSDAEQNYRLLVVSYPSDVDARSGLGWSLLKQGKKAEALQMFGEVLEYAPKSALALEGRAALGAR